VSTVTVLTLVTHVSTVTVFILTLVTCVSTVTVFILTLVIRVSIVTVFHLYNKSGLIYRVFHNVLRDYKHL